MCIRDSFIGILFIAFFGIGYGAYYATADMPIPMVACLLYTSRCV